MHQLSGCAGQQYADDGEVAQPIDKPADSLPQAGAATVTVVQPAS
jgi:hypothetical protein